MAKLRKIWDKCRRSNVWTEISKGGIAATIILNGGGSSFTSLIN